MLTVLNQDTTVQSEVNIPAELPIAAPELGIAPKSIEALFAPPTAEEIAHRLAALETLGRDIPNRRAAAGLGTLDLAGERGDVYGYTERENSQR